jgi:membrane protein
LKDVLKSLYHDVRFYYGAFKRLELHNKAASLSYYTVISIFPMMLLFTAMLGFIMPGADWVPGIRRFLDDALPMQSQLVLSNIDALMRHKAKFSWFGAGSLVVSAQMLYVNMDRIINRILHEQRNRSVVMTRLFFFPWLAGMVFVLFTPLIFDVAYAKLKGYGWQFSTLAVVSVKSGFVIAAFLMFFFVMVMLPLQRIALSRIARAGLFFALTLQVGKFVFKRVTLLSLGRYNIVYGSLSSIVLGLVWIFYFYAMFLFFAYWAGRRRDPHYVEKKTGRFPQDS